MPVAEARPKLRHLQAVGQERGLLAQVQQRVFGEGLERLAHTAALLGERARELVDLALAPCGKARAVSIEAGAPNDDRLAVLDLLEELGAGGIDQANPSLDERQRAGIRIVAGRRRRHVHDHAHPALEQLLGRDQVEVGVVDDRDVVGPETPDEALRALV